MIMLNLLIGRGTYLVIKGNNNTRKYSLNTTYNNIPHLNINGNYLDLNEVNSTDGTNKPYLNIKINNKTYRPIQSSSTSDTQNVSTTITCTSSSEYTKSGETATTRESGYSYAVTTKTYYSAVDSGKWASYSGYKVVATSGVGYGTNPSDCGQATYSAMWNAGVNAGSNADAHRHDTEYFMATQYGSFYPTKNVTLLPSQIYTSSYTQAARVYANQVFKSESQVHGATSTMHGNGYKAAWATCYCTRTYYGNISSGGAVTSAVGPYYATSAANATRISNYTSSKTSTLTSYYDSTQNTTTTQSSSKSYTYT